jgi:hypothetical protein
MIDGSIEPISDAELARLKASPADADPQHWIPRLVREVERLRAQLALPWLLANPRVNESVRFDVFGAAARSLDAEASRPSLEVLIITFLRARDQESFCAPCLAEKLGASAREMREALAGPLTSRFTARTTMCSRCGRRLRVIGGAKQAET